MPHKLAILILAAGHSRRMGQDKAALEFKGQSWLQCQVECIEKCFSKERDSKINTIIFIICRSKQRGLLGDLVKDYRSIEFIENEAEESEKWQSLILGLTRAREGKAEAILVCPIDVPISEVAISSMIQAYKGRSVIPVHEGLRGHPVLLSADATNRFIESPQRLDYFLRAEEIDTVSVSDSKILLNLNTLERWQSFKNAEELKPYSD